MSNCEQQLISRCRSGDSAAWDELFECFYDPAARFIFQLSKDFSREDVEEICQDTFLSVIHNISGFHGECAFQTWLFRIASNKAADFRERQNALKRGGGTRPLSLQAEDPETGLTLEVPGKQLSPAALLEREEQTGLVHRALEQLEPPCREVIELRYFADLSYEEISRALKINAKTVSSRLSKCLDRLEILVRKLFTGENLPVFPSNS